MESSLNLAVPGSSKDINEAVEKVKQEVEKSKKSTKSKKKADEYRIKIHIAEIISRQTYLLKLCRALMVFGAPTHRLEAYMRMSARVLGIEAQFLYLPDTMIISFDDSTIHTTEVKIVRASQGLDFGRLRDVHEIYKEVVHDRIGVEEATARLNDITKRKPKFPVWLRILFYGVASAVVAPFGFEGRYIDMPICFILGCLVGFLQLYLSPSNELYANVFEITAAVATSFLARVFGSIRNGQLFCFSSLAQASIALILPGYMVLCASLELQSHQMISGSVRMVYALIYTLFLGYGFTIGSVIYGYMDDNAVSAVHCSVGDSWYTQRPPENFYILFVLPFTLCLCAINQAKWQQMPGKKNSPAHTAFAHHQDSNPPCFQCKSPSLWPASASTTSPPASSRATASCRARSAPSPLACWPTSTPASAATPRTTSSTSGSATSSPAFPAADTITTTVPPTTTSLGRANPTTQSASTKKAWSTTSRWARPREQTPPIPPRPPSHPPLLALQLSAAVA
jgi:uncharacterized membrane protein YjjP (DUF1212 family)